MNISPRDVVLINGEFFYVHATSTKKTLTGESVTISGVNINGVKDDGVPVEDGNIQPFMVNLPKQDAERLFDRDRQLIRLATAAHHGDGLEAYNNHILSIPWRTLPLFDSAPAKALCADLRKVEADLKEAYAWVEKKRYECLDAFDNFHEYYHARKNQYTFSEPESIYDNVRLGEAVFHVGGIYKFMFHNELAAKAERDAYVKVTGVTHDRALITLTGDNRGGVTRDGYIERIPRTCVLECVIGKNRFRLYDNDVKEIPIGSFQDIETYRELERFNETTSLEETLNDIYLDTFSAGDGKPACLPSRTKLEQEPSLWRGNYDESCASLMNRTADMLFDIERSAAHADRVRTQLEEFYGINK